MDSIRRRGNSEVSLLPTLEYSQNKLDELPAGQNFARKRIERSSPTSLLRQGTDSLKKRKQLKHMANQFRKQIFKINDNLNVRVPPLIQQQA